MKIVLIGSDEVWSIERLYLRHLNEIPGVEAAIFSTSSRVKQRSHTLHRLDRRLRPARNQLFRAFNAALLREVPALQPDLVLVFKGMEIFPETLQQLKAKTKALLANYNPDHPFQFHSRGSGNANVTSAIALYDLHFSYHRQVVERIKADYQLPAYWLPFGYDDKKKITREALRQKEEIPRIAFIGNPDRIRFRFIQAVVAAGLPIDVYGENWKRWFQPKGQHGLRIFPAVYGEAFVEAMSRYRVQLNIFRPHNEGSHNMRTFEAPAVGAIMLAPLSEEHTVLFSQDEEAFFYTNVAETVGKGQKLLQLSKEAAMRCKQQALQRSEKSGYSYADRAAQLVSTVQREF